MDAETLIRELRDMGVTLRVDGPDLVVRPASGIPADLVEELRAHKAAILETLTHQGDTALVEDLTPASAWGRC